jgi:adenylate cyclase
MGRLCMRASKLASRFTWVPCWLSLLVALVLVVASPLWHHLTELWRDGSIRRHSPEVRVDPRIALILIDDDSLKKLPEWTAFWLPYYGKVIRASLDAGALAAGLDVIVSDTEERRYREEFPKMGPDEHPWTDLGMAVATHPNLWVQGIFPDLQTGATRSLARRDTRDYKPAPEVTMLAGSNLGYLNLSRDVDDEVLRRQMVRPLPINPSVWGLSSCTSFAGRLAEILGVHLDPRQGLLPIAFARPEKIPRYSLAQVLEWANHDPQRLRQAVSGKAVLIGSGTRLLPDYVQTPIGEILGVEAHALTLNTLLNHTFWRPLAAWQTTTLFWIFGLLAGVAGSRWRPIALMLGLLALSAAGLELGDWMLAGPGRLLDVPGLLLATWMSGLATWLIQWWRQEQEQRLVRKLFGRYVSQAVMEELLEDPSQAVLGAIGKRELTVLFTDINGFSTICERRSPEEIMDMLNLYFEEMNGIIFRHGGMIKQFVGDEIMVMFGAPRPHPHAERAAVQTAVDMIRRLRELEAADQGQQSGFFHIKVGIHRGPVILGNVGSAERTEYAAVGDDVNLGSRIMSMAKPLDAEILISADVLEYVRDLPGVRYVSKGSHVVKGRDEPVAIYQVVVE